MKPHAALSKWRKLSIKSSAVSPDMGFDRWIIILKRLQKKITADVFAPLPIKFFFYIHIFLIMFRAEGYFSFFEIFLRN